MSWSVQKFLCSASDGLACVVFSRSSPTCPALYSFTGYLVPRGAQVHFLHERFKFLRSVPKSNESCSGVLSLQQSRHVAVTSVQAFVVWICLSCHEHQGSTPLELSPGAWMTMRCSLAYRSDTESKTLVGKSRFASGVMSTNSLLGAIKFLPFVPPTGAHSGFSPHTYAFRTK